jgi:hypothetical protein
MTGTTTPSIWRWEQRPSCSELITSERLLDNSARFLLTFAENETCPWLTVFENQLTIHEKNLITSGPAHIPALVTTSFTSVRTEADRIARCAPLVTPTIAPSWMTVCVGYVTQAHL